MTTRRRSPRCPASAAVSPRSSAAGSSRYPDSTPTSSPRRYRPLDVVGAPTVRIRAASPTGQAVLFVKLYDVDPQNGLTLPDGLVAPVRLTGLPASIDQAAPVTVTLPAIVHEFQAGHLMRITIASAD